MTKVRLDEIDKKILNILQADARAPIAEISRGLKLSETSVRYRIKKLVDSGIISSFMAILIPEKIGLTACAIVGFRVDPGRINDVITRLLAVSGHMEHVCRCTGEYDISAVVYAKDIGELRDLLEEMKSIEGVRDFSLSIVTRRVRPHVAYKL